MCGSHHRRARWRENEYEDEVYRYDLDPDERDDRRQREFVSHAMRFGTVFAVCMAIWLLSGAGYFWPMWVLLIGGLKLGAHARHAFVDRYDDRDLVDV